MGEMIANIAHQWRQPLSAISTLSTGLQLEVDLNLASNGDVSKGLVKINDISQHLSSTIEDFRNFFKEDSIQENFCLKEAIIDSINIIDANLKTTDITMVTNLEKCDFYGNKNSIKQAFINIINNAKDALVEKNIEEKIIYISLISVADVYVLNIIDNAGGIPNDIMTKIFEPYFTTKHQSQGTGIGLYMTKEILEKHSNCTINVTNIDEEFDSLPLKGAKFTIEFPKDINVT
jgi:signal transduction histidine kinase